MKKENILIIILVAAIIITAFVWFRYFQNRPPPALIQVGGGSAEEKEIMVGGKEFIALLKTLEKIKLDTSFLGDPIYKSLRDLTPQIILPQEKGRENPFTPF